MADIGYIALLLALFTSAYTTIAFVIAARNGNARTAESARNGFLVSLGLVSLSVASLLFLLLTHRFDIAYVADYSSRDMSPLYIISSLWAGNAGSLLVWAWLLTIFGGVFLLARWNKGRHLVPYASAVMMFSTFFFLLVILATANPFQNLGFTPADGSGLNPLLENPGMLIHPITLLAGYVGLAMPFAIAISALATRRLDTEWVIEARKYTLAAWLFLGIGNILGAWWSYAELGWGGYWAWDPVENASLMPWLVATALLHSLSMQRRRGNFKMWNMGLVTFTFLLTVFGTFLTRSGILSSVHAFPNTGIGPYFITFLLAAAILAVVLMYARRDELADTGEAESLVSREGTFLLNNLLMVGSTLVILLGTMWPLLSSMFGGRQVEVGKAFFNRVNGPLFLVIILLAGVCTTIGWRRASGKNLVRNLLWPAVAGLVGAGIAFGVGVHQIAAVAAVFIGVFVLGTIVFEWSRGIRGRVRSLKENVFEALWKLLSANRPRYGGYIVHIGMVIFALGVVASSLYSVQKDVTLMPGESATIGKYTVTYDGLESYSMARRDGVKADLSVSSGNTQMAGLASFKFYDPRQSVDQRQWVTEVGIRSSVTEDLYIVLISWDTDQSAAFQLMVNPLIMWMWVGGGILVLGGLFAFWPAPESAKAIDNKARRSKV
jgi:cytochrome c-type biogenesis protein CcmF